MMGAMEKDKIKSQKITRGLILGALVLYVFLGGGALRYYFYDPYDEDDPGIEAEKSLDAIDHKEATETKALMPTKPAQKPYDTQKGEAGAARDLDIE